MVFGWGAMACRVSEGAVQSLSRPACKPAVQPSDPKRPEKKCRGGGRFELWQSEARDTACTHTRRIFSPYKKDSANGRNERAQWRRTEEQRGGASRRWKARRQPQQAAPDRWPAHYRLPCKMAFGAGQPQRCTDAPACLCSQGADAIHAPAVLIYMHRPKPALCGFFLACRGARPT